MARGVRAVHDGEKDEAAVRASGLNAVTCVQHTQSSQANVAPGPAWVQFAAPSMSSSAAVVVAMASSSSAPAATEATPIARTSAGLWRGAGSSATPAGDFARAPRVGLITTRPSKPVERGGRRPWPIKVPKNLRLPS